MDAEQGGLTQVRAADGRRWRRIDVDEGREDGEEGGRSNAKGRLTQRTVRFGTETPYWIRGLTASQQWDFVSLGITPRWH